ncbi:adenylate kinase, chloroplastic [Herrania umbratica]|uniref:adenylate kinase n=1 Tax=Herrania umbratica TaxID=108875 RepID=A0A6J1AMH3_9ROSI|nr:adenylate kinase, chloroplastic [Herrania umbratica]XP_021287749.1 adenylate kinase, chloroplastic [Herrania umbratica]
MASSSCLNIAITQPCVSLSPSFSPNSKQPNQSLLPQSSFTPIHSSSLALRSNQILSHPRSYKLRLPNAPNFHVAASAKVEPLKVMISGAPASGKGTQCELITKRYGLVHIAAGDLLRAEVASASENGKRAKEYMEKGELVPDEIVVMMVRERLLQPDSQEKGWLLDGYPRSLSQAAGLEDFGIHPDVFILLEVPEDILVERVVGRRLDPITGKIYHLKYSPPENEEIASRLTQRFDDTEEKVKLRLRTHHQNVEAVLSKYKDITVKVNGNAPKENVFAQIDAALIQLLELRKENSGSMAA